MDNKQAGNDQADANQAEFRRRDIATLHVLGIFFAIMGALVLVATYEAIGNTPAVVVSICSGLTLLVIGVGMIGYSRRMAHRSDD